MFKHKRWSATIDRKHRSAMAQKKGGKKIISPQISNIAQ
jgi:hypothetical protein